MPPITVAVYFNSRPSARGDQSAPTPCAVALISIHAPPRGATIYKYSLWNMIHISIHAPPRGATACRSTILSGVPIFQFTPLREGRRYHRLPLRTVRHFNSRPSARGDGIGNDYVALGAISIHAPPRGATGTRTAPASCSSDFNSRPSARGDLSRCRNSDIQCISIHAPPRGATSEVVAKNNSYEISIHAPPRGATRKRNTVSVLSNDFNSRPSARGDGRLWCFYFHDFISIHAPPRGATHPMT